MTDISKIDIKRINGLLDEIENINNQISLINTTLSNKIQLVSELTETMEDGILYCIPE